MTHRVAENPAPSEPLEEAPTDRALRVAAAGAVATAVAAGTQAARSVSAQEGSGLWGTDQGEILRGAGSGPVETCSAPHYPATQLHKNRTVETKVTLNEH